MGQELARVAPLCVESRADRNGPRTHLGNDGVTALSLDKVSHPTRGRNVEVIGTDELRHSGVIVRVGGGRRGGTCSPIRCGRSHDGGEEG